jgi:hypothetical protein
MEPVSRRVATFEFSQPFQRLDRHGTRFVSRSDV